MERVSYADGVCSLSVGGGRSGESDSGGGGASVDLAASLRCHLGGETELEVSYEGATVQIVLLDFWVQLARSSGAGVAKEEHPADTPWAAVRAAPAAAGLRADLRVLATRTLSPLWIASATVEMTLGSTVYGDERMVPATPIAARALRELLGEDSADVLRADSVDTAVHGVACAAELLAAMDAADAAEAVPDASFVSGARSGSLITSASGAASGAAPATRCEHADELPLATLVEASALALELTRSSSSPRTRVDELGRALDVLWSQRLEVPRGGGDGVRVAAAAHTRAAATLAALPLPRIAQVVASFIRELERRAKAAVTLAATAAAATIHGRARNRRSTTLPNVSVDRASAWVAHVLRWVLQDPTFVPRAFERFCPTLQREARRVLLLPVVQSALLSRKTGDGISGVGGGGTHGCRTSAVAAVRIARAVLRGERLKPGGERSSKRARSTRWTCRYCESSANVNSDHICALCGTERGKTRPNYAAYVKKRKQLDADATEHAHRTLQTDARHRQRVSSSPEGGDDSQSSAPSSGDRRRRSGGERSAASLAQRSRAGSQLPQHQLLAIGARHAASPSPSPSPSPPPPPLPSERRRQRRRRHQRAGPDLDLDLDEETRENDQLLEILHRLSQSEEPVDPTLQRPGTGFVTQHERNGLFTEEQVQLLTTPLDGLPPTACFGEGHTTLGRFCAREELHSAAATHVALARAILRHQWHVRHTTLLASGRSGARK